MKHRAHPTLEENSINSNNLVDPLIMISLNLLPLKSKGVGLVYSAAITIFHKVTNRGLDLVYESDTKESGSSLFNCLFRFFHSDS